MSTTHEPIERGRQTGTRAEADARAAYVEASIRESTDRLIRDWHFSPERARQLAEQYGRERFEKEAHGMQTRRLWRYAQEHPPTDDTPMPDHPLVEIGQGEHAKPIYAEDIKVENPLKGALIAVAMLGIAALLFAAAACLGA